MKLVLTLISLAAGTAALLSTVEMMHAATAVVENAARQGHP